MPSLHPSFGLLLLCLLPPYGAAPTPTTYCVTGTFLRHGPAFVTCVFPENVNGSSKLSFNVIHYPSEVYALLCNWNDNEPACHQEDGYTLNSSMSNLVRVDIPRVSSHQAGIYKCHLVPGNGVQAAPCTLEVQEVFIQPYSNQTADNRTAPVPDCEFNGCDHSALIAVSVFLGLAVVVIIFMAVCLCRAKKWHF